MTKTGCECPLSGYCNKHGINKSAHLHKLCQNNDRYFKMWEECKGPGQYNVDCNNLATAPAPASVATAVLPTDTAPVKLPSLIQQAKNLASATVAHVADGLKTAGRDEKERRLSICQTCPYLIPESMRCGKCGCHLETKASWESSHCPIQKW